jgi:hypothetical protein
MIVGIKLQKKGLKTKRHYVLYVAIEMTGVNNGHLNEKRCKKVLALDKPFLKV